MVQTVVHYEVQQIATGLKNSLLGAESTFRFNLSLKMSCSTAFWVTLRNEFPDYVGMDLVHPQILK